MRTAGCAGSSAAVCPFQMDGTTRSSVFNPAMANRRHGSSSGCGGGAWPRVRGQQFHPGACAHRLGGVCRCAFRNYHCGSDHSGQQHLLRRARYEDTTLVLHVLLECIFSDSDSQSHAGAIAGVVPFAIGAYEFGKRIVSGCTTTAAPSCCMLEAAAAHKLHTAALQR